MTLENPQTDDNAGTRRALQLTKMKHIDNVEPINDGDFDCIDEVRAVLEKYGALGRFGLTLLHKHFDVEDDEVLVEYCDEENRRLTLEPVKHADLDKDCCLIPTLYVFDELSHRPRHCAVCSDGSHYGYKDVRI